LPGDDQNDALDFEQRRDQARQLQRAFRAILRGLQHSNCVVNPSHEPREYRACRLLTIADAEVAVAGPCDGPVNR